MSHLSKVLLLLGVVALAACQNPDRLGSGAGSAANGAGGGTGGIQTAALGDPSDPSSPAHFNERIGDRVFFTTDQSTLSQEARETLTRQARWLNDNPDFGVVIEGHADERGTREYNVALGARRANAVQEFLNERGISRQRMRTVSFGKERPVEACPEQRCWDLNRRAVTVISTGLTS